MLSKKGIYIPVLLIIKHVKNLPPLPVMQAIVTHARADDQTNLFVHAYRTDNVVLGTFPWFQSYTPYRTERAKVKADNHKAILTFCNKTIQINFLKFKSRWKKMQKLNFSYK